MMKTPPKMGGISHRGDVPAGAIGAQTLGAQDVGVGLPKNPLNVGEASQAEPMTSVAQNPIATMGTPQNRIGRYPAQ